MFGLLRSLFETVCVAVTGILTCAKIKLKKFLGIKSDPEDSALREILSIRAFNEGPSQDDHKIEHFRPRESFVKIRETVETILGWEKYRIEVKYMSHGSKYRAIYRKENESTESTTFPPRKRIGPVTTPRIVCATLHMHDGTWSDVTDKVIKYHGPNRDFHSGLGLKLVVSDAFPWERPDSIDLLRVAFERGTVVQWKSFIHHDYLTNP
jgi:hypothetical protein